MSDVTTTTITEAVAILQSAQQDLVAAKASLVDHNNDEDAHHALQERLSKLENSDTLYTNADIDARINEQLDVHKNDSFKTAHTGWDEYETTVTNAMTDLHNDVEELKLKVDTGADDDQTETSLSVIIRQIELKYAAQLEALQNSYQSAKDNGQDELAELYKQNIQVTLDAKNAEILKAIEDWQNSGSGSGSGDEGEIIPSLTNQITQLREEVAEYKATVDNLANISTTVGQNRSDIASLKNSVQTNADNIAVNATGIITNANAIQSNTRADAEFRVATNAALQSISGSIEHIVVEEFNDEVYPEDPAEEPEVPSTES